MSDYGAPPAIPSNLQVYNSYQEDPKWQKKFTIVWATAVGIAVLAALPQLIRAVRSRQAFTGLFGVWEDLSGSWYGPAAAQETIPPRRGRKAAALLRTVGSALLWSPMGFGLDLGQIVVVVGYVATVLVCITMQAPLMDNPNRAGFLAIAQLPVVFLFGTKNSILSLLLGPGNGYEKLNYVHRWAGRGVFLGAAIHGSLWIRNHLQYDLPILGQQKETSGVAAFALLCIIVLTSLRPVRVFFYQCFFIVHVLTYVAFFVTLCYHTIYASPWIYPPLAFYGLDLLMRMFRYRIKDATLVPADDQMTLIHVRDCDGGWKAGQHVRLRVFFGGRVFESHPLTIMNAPAATSCTPTRTIALGARVKGDWTRALNRYAKEEQSRIAGALGEKKEDVAEIPVQVMLDGPYGGCSVDLGRYESVLLLAGGAGATFTLSLLDDIVGRCVKLGRRNGERTRRIEFAWAIRSFGCIEWFAPMLMEIASAAAGSSIDLHISVFVTCLCNPEAVPPIPNSMVTVEKPSIQTLLKELITPPAAREDAESAAAAAESMKADLRWAGEGGGVAVCASGPERMTREAQNAVAKLSVSHGMRMGGIALHTELFSL